MIFTALQEAQCAGLGASLVMESLIDSLTVHTIISGSTVPPVVLIEMSLDGVHWSAVATYATGDTSTITKIDTGLFLAVRANVSHYNDGKITVIFAIKPVVQIR